MGIPLTTEEYVKRHKADFQALGFDIQFLAFVIFLLEIKGGDVIKYETEDDFVILCADGTKWLIQVKNSVDDDAKMTDADSDFWKTFDNWLTLYALSTSKVDFLKDGNRFILYTNKTLSNSFYEHIKGLKQGKMWHRRSHFFFAASKRNGFVFSYSRKNVEVRKSGVENVFAKS